jgi:hypothetical protein
MTRPEINGVPIHEVSLYKIDHLYSLIASEADGTYLQTGTFPIGAPRFHTESAHASIGVSNEHFLHHRRRRRHHLCGRFFRTARLIKKF